jgi:hypothetical protein
VLDEQERTDGSNLTWDELTAIPKRIRDGLSSHPKNLECLPGLQAEQAIQSKTMAQIDLLQNCVDRDRFDLIE